MFDAEPMSMPVLRPAILTHKFSADVTFGKIDVAMREWAFAALAEIRVGRFTGVQS